MILSLLFKNGLWFTRVSFLFQSLSVFIYSASQIKQALIYDMNFGASGSSDCDHSRTITTNRAMNTDCPMESLSRGVNAWSR